ncbi:Fc receptor-like protein 2 [Hyaena hyaena]|uniref:Fc receptor-like protein 2 n=1 Tax=Hyaena hyaena TaxID=95912 RepID=UPI0019224B82|nr:Fc receptor-like protein 2 [Hyaena hyaena]
MLLWSLLVILAPVSGKSDWLTLRAPSAVFEGDRIDLTCQKKKDLWKVKTVAYYKDREELQLSDKVLNFSIQRAVLSDSGNYYCAVDATMLLLQKKDTSRSVTIKVQELFLHPVLRVSPSWPTEGSPVTLTCETQLSPQRSSAQLRFCFFRDGRALGSGWGSSPELRVPAMWTEDSGSYWCEAETLAPTVGKQSLQSQVHVRRVPVSNVSLEMRPPRGEVVEGGNLVLLCSVAEGTGDITFSWHREATGTSVGRKIQRSLSAELEVPAVQENDAGRYYCRADNGHGPAQSKVLSVLVRIPVSCPVLTVRAPRDLTMEGDMVELQCEAQRGSPPILYWFYHEDNALGNSSAPFGGEASFNLSVTAEHSGNYSCEADNGLGAQRSEAVPLSISVTSIYRKDRVTDRALGLLGVPACIAAALLIYCRFRKTSGGRSATDTLRDASSANPQWSTASSPSPAVEDLQPDYVNVDPEDGDVVYSLVQSIQPPGDTANTRSTILETKDPRVIYSDVKM